MENDKKPIAPCRVRSAFYAKFFIRGLTRSVNGPNIRPVTQKGKRANERRFKIDTKAVFKPALSAVGVRANLFRSVETAQAIVDKAGLRDGEYRIHPVIVTRHYIR